MGFFTQKGFKEALIVAGLAAWASITLCFMIVRSWTAGNSRWVCIFAGLICFAAALAVNAWRVVFLREGSESDG